MAIMHIASCSTLIASVLLWGALTSDVAAAPLPASFSLPAQARVGAVDEEYDFGEAAFPIAGKAGNVEENIRRGHLWHTSIMLGGVPDDAAVQTIWARLRPALLNAGWEPVAEFADSYTVTLRRKQGAETWANLAFFNPGDIRVSIVEIGLPRRKLTLPPPVAKPESIAPEQGDIPYLLPLPGAKFSGGEVDPEAQFFATLPGQNEPALVATGTLTRRYDAPAGMSAVEFATVYEEALKAAGWQIVEKSQGLQQTDAQLIAHYVGNGRDIWAKLHSAIAFTVADAGKQDLAQALRKDCRVTLTGVFFDFDKASLKPESAPALSRARDAIKANAGLALEVQGHTDAVGNDAYNQKLSEARAQSVMNWLAANSIPATRLSAKGYGKTRPVASNDTDEGRARNRRVELVCRK